MAKHLTSWAASIPSFPEDCLPNDATKNEIPKSFIKSFNFNPNSAITTIQESKPELKNPYFLGNFLCTVQGISPLQLRKFVFSDINHSKTILYHIFSAINIEFMSIENAAHLLLSRIAFSNNIKEIRIIIESFVSAYVSANPSTQMNKLHLLRTVAVYILLSATIGQPIEMTLEKFSKYMEKVRLVHATSIKEIYQSMKEAPIAIFLPFVINTSEKPILTKTSLVKKKADFALKKKRFIEVSNKKFRCYNDQTKKVLNVEFSLKNVHDELPNEGKDFNKIILTTYTEEPLYVKSKKKEFDYSFTVDDDREVLLWREAINYNSFLATLTSYIKQLKAAN